MSTAIRYSEAMARTGHGYWVPFLLLALVVGGIPIAAGVIGLARLRARLWRTPNASARRPRPRVPEDGPSYLGDFVSLLPRLFAVILVGFTIQENFEAWGTGAALPGLHVLSLMVLQVLFAISFLIALAGAWLRWREVVLQRRLVAARQNDQRAPRHRAAEAAPRWTEIAATVAHRWLVARRIAGRAPPAPRAV